MPDPMKRFPILNDLSLSADEAAFIAKADTSATAEINQTRIVSEMYVIKKHQELVTEVIASNERLSTATARHTRALVWVTGALVLFTAGQVIVSLLKG